LNDLNSFKGVPQFLCGGVVDGCYFAKTDTISHPAFVRVWLGFETGVAEYFRAPVFFAFQDKFLLQMAPGRTNVGVTPTTMYFGAPYIAGRTQSLS
jgi:hypothetical protein